MVSSCIDNNCILNVPDAECLGCCHVLAVLSADCPELCVDCLHLLEFLTRSKAWFIRALHLLT